jgi:hypothetical protein
VNLWRSGILPCFARRNECELFGAIKLASLDAIHYF